MKAEVTYTTPYHIGQEVMVNTGGYYQKWHQYKKMTIKGISIRVDERKDIFVKYAMTEGLEYYPNSVLSLEEFADYEVKQAQEHLEWAIQNQVNTLRNARGQ